MVKIYINHYGLYTLAIDNLHCEEEFSTAYRGSILAIGRIRSCPVLGQNGSSFDLLLRAQINVKCTTLLINTTKLAIYLATKRYLFDDQTTELFNRENHF